MQYIIILKFFCGKYGNDNDVIKMISMKKVNNI